MKCFCACDETAPSRNEGDSRAKPQQVARIETSDLSFLFPSDHQGRATKVFHKLDIENSPTVRSHRPSFQSCELAMTRSLEFTQRILTSASTAATLTLILVLIVSSCTTRPEVDSATTFVPTPTPHVDYRGPQLGPSPDADDPGDPGPPGAPGPAGADVADNYTNIDVLDGTGTYPTRKIVWDAAGSNVFVTGSGFMSGETVALTISGEIDTAVGSATANDSGAFATDVTLDSGFFAIGDVKSLVVMGDQGSRASTALLVVETEQPR